MRFLKRLGLVLLGVVTGFAAAAAIARRAVPSRGDAQSDEVALVAIFDGIELKSTAGGFRGGSMLAWFGGVAVDLREATLAPDAHLTVHALFGGIALRVPPGWKVESSAKSIMGGVAVQVPSVDAEDPPTLTLDGYALFGGIAVGARPADDDAGDAD
jgi:hypothetical protein